MKKLLIARTNKKQQAGHWDFLLVSYNHWKVFIQTIQCCLFLTQKNVKSIKSVLFGDIAWVNKPKLYHFNTMTMLQGPRLFVSQTGSNRGNRVLLCWQYLWYEMFCFQTHWSIYRDGFLSAEEPNWDHCFVDKLDTPNITITLQAFVLMQL